MRGSRGTAQPFLRGEIWWIQYTLPDGRRIRESSQSRKKLDAIHVLRQRHDQITQARLSAQEAKFAQVLKGATTNA
jgi:hypothetical protein